MLKYILLFVLSFSANAFQTKQQIIDYCVHSMIKIGGNKLVLACVKQELIARDELMKVAKS